MLTNLNHSDVLRRAKPMLGTLVDIGIAAADSDLALEAASAAFTAIRDVHRLMSFHEPSSDLSRINRAAPGIPVAVDLRTADVLRLALDMNDASAGAFDCTVATVLVQHGLLPPAGRGHVDATRGPSNTRPGGPGHSAVDRARAFVVDGCTVIKQRDCLIDLGGIAKGYAVDRAVEAAVVLGNVRGHPIRSVFVNAGGDLRYQGTGSVTIRMRDCDDPARLTGVADLFAGALASTSTRGLDGRARHVSPLVDPLGEIPLPLGAGVTVAAPTCAIADALTKVALVTGDPAHPIFEHYGASVVRYSG